MRAANRSTIAANISRSGNNKLTEPGNAVPTCGIRISQCLRRQRPSKNSGRQLMSESREWPRIAVVGAGAVGGYFGGVFARTGAPTVFIGRKHFADAVNSKGLVLDKL